MKEVSKINQDPVEETRQEVKKDLQKKIVGRIRPSKNHILYKYDKKDGSLKRIEAEPAKVIDWSEKGLKFSNKSVKAEEGCIYVTALNLKNAIKKLAKYHGLSIQIKNK